jgi:hypothetical protein
MAGSCFWPEPFRPHVFLYTETSPPCQSWDENKIHQEEQKAERFLTADGHRFIGAELPVSDALRATQKPRVELPVFDAAENRCRNPDAVVRSVLKSWRQKPVVSKAVHAPCVAASKTGSSVSSADS